MNCISCYLVLDYEKFVYVRDMSTANLHQVQVTGRVPFDPSPEPTRHGPYCHRCQSHKLAELRQHYQQISAEGKSGG
jgi:hypothetical protein